MSRRPSPVSRLYQAALEYVRNDQVEHLRGFVSKYPECTAYADPNDGGHTLLHKAIIARKPQCALVLVRVRDGADARTANEDSYTALHLLAKHGAGDAGEAVEAQLVQELLGAGCSVLAATRAGRTPLHHAARYGNRGVLATLLQVPGIDVSVEDVHGQTPLHLAASHLHAVTALLDAGCDPRKADAVGYNVMHYACCAGAIDCVREINARDERVKCDEDKDRRTPLHVAAQKGHADIVALLIGDPAGKGLVHRIDSCNRTPLHDAALAGHPAVMSMLLDAGANVESRCDTNDARDDATPLHLALSGKHTVAARVLLRDYQADASAFSSLGTPLQLCLGWPGGAEVLGLLLERLEHKPPAMLHLAAETDNSDAIQPLLSFGASVHERDSKNRTVFDVAVAKGSTSFLRDLLALIEDTEARAIVNEWDSEGLLLIHHAAAVDHVGVVRVLLAHGTDIRQCEERRVSPLEIAAKRGCAPIIDALLVSGASVRSSNNNGRCALHYAARANSIECLTLLLQHHTSPPVDVPDIAGNTPLALAAAAGALDACQLLLAEHANANVLNSHGQGPLEHAMNGGHADVVKLLLNRGASTDVKNANGKTPLECGLLESDRRYVRDQRVGSKTTPSGQKKKNKKKNKKSKQAKHRSLLSSSESDAAEKMRLERELAAHKRRSSQLQQQLEQAPLFGSAPLIGTPFYTMRTRGGLRVLLIDGGGTRGIIPLTMLMEIERIYNVRVTDLFDLVVGTSIGAVIAVLAFHFGLDLEMVREMYEEMVEKIFRNPRSRVTGGGITRSRYDSDAALVLLEQFVGYAQEHGRFAEQRKRAMPSELAQLPKVVVVAQQEKLDRSLSRFVFRNYEMNSPYATAGVCVSGLAWALALRASTAAPTYFDPSEFEGRILVDGGLVDNHPGHVALDEAIFLCIDAADGAAVPPSIQCVLSLGTGYMPLGSKRGNHIKGAMDLLRHSVTHSESKWCEFVSKAACPLYGAFNEHCFRLNPCIKKSHADLDVTDKKKLANLAAAAEFTVDSHKADLSAFLDLAIPNSAAAASAAAAASSSQQWIGSATVSTVPRVRDNPLKAALSGVLHQAPIRLTHEQADAVRAYCKDGGAGVEQLRHGGGGEVYSMPISGSLRGVVKLIEVTGSCEEQHVQRQRVQREVAALRHATQLTSGVRELFVNLLAACIDDNGAVVVTEQVSGGSLATWLKERPDELLPQSRLAIVADITMAMATLHGLCLPDGRPAALAHRDLKPSNVLLCVVGSATSSIRAKLCDFGLCKTLRDEQCTATALGDIGGSFLYMAPEVFDYINSGPAHSESGLIFELDWRKADVFSLGIVIVETLCGRRPNTREVGSARLPPVPKVKDRVLADALMQCRAVAQDCLEVDPTQRPSMASVARRCKEILTRLDGE